MSIAIKRLFKEKFSKNSILTLTTYGITTPKNCEVQYGILYDKRGQHIDKGLHNNCEVQYGILYDKRGQHM